MKPLATKVPR